ncbi:MAG: ABC transporter ATP-binding protein [Candidatus Kapabacteria bacterium]|nr:ABC transporter ATP-binding protein [Ignavibacteria bacterium]MBK7577265.1 ABC transporter ATP-binding protein [Ignavibacteria bacterium]MBP6510440.1 ABC transporter ATP-binding protein [Candidatus Kapabacteria bacterium]MBP7093488.1 ABC transporter ATP-binding protein [Candidatus Kapabacteria bacterium]
MSEPARNRGVLTELRRILPYTRRYPKLVGWGLVFITLSNVCSTTIPHVVGETIDTLKVSAFASSEIAWLIAQILLLTIGSGFFMFATRRTIILMSRFIEEDLRNDFVKAIKDQSQRFFHDRSTGSLLAHFSNDIGAVREFIGPAIMYTANTITTFAFALTWMMNINIPLTFAILIPVPLVATLTYKLGKLIHANYKRVQEQYEHITTHAQETASGVRVVRAYVRGDHEAERFDELSADYYRKNMRLARVQSLMMPGMTVLFNLSYVIVISFGGYLVMQSSMSVGELTQFFIYLNQLLWPIAAIGWVTSMIQRGAASMARLGAIFEAPSDIVDADNAQRPDEIRGTIEFDNVSLAYDGTTPVLSNISVTVPAGSSLGIVGTVGSGKSSLIGLLPRLYDVTSGAVRIDGIDVRNISIVTLRGSIAVVPQESFLFSETIRENIRFGRPTATDEEVVQAAQRAQLHADVMSLPQGYDTVVGERGVTLSGGQKQRTSLARAIASDPSILVLDDSLSAIDADTEERILRGLDDVMKGRTTILISHRISTVKKCTNIIVLQNGTIAEQGSHNELLELGGIYADMYERQQLEQQLTS